MHKIWWRIRQGGNDIAVGIVIAGIIYSISKNDIVSLIIWIGLLIFNLRTRTNFSIQDKHDCQRCGRGKEIW